MPLLPAPAVLPAVSRHRGGRGLGGRGRWLSRRSLCRFARGCLPGRRRREPARTRRGIHLGAIPSGCRPVVRLLDLQNAEVGIGILPVVLRLCRRCHRCRSSTQEDSKRNAQQRRSSHGTVPVEKGMTDVRSGESRMQDRPHDRRVDPVDEFHVADPRREDEPEPAADGLFVAGHRGEQRVARKTGAVRHGHR